MANSVHDDFHCCAYFPLFLIFDVINLGAQGNARI